MDSETLQFDFGENWAHFSAAALTPARVAQARCDFVTLMKGVPIAGSHFLDIGFGQGLSLLTAAALGAKAFGCDVNPKCAAVIAANRKHFPDVAEVPKTVVGSILDPQTVLRLRELGRPDGTFDTVHSWGVLHHTGDMRKAIEHTASLVVPGGYLVVALYNRHWSSRPWLAIKWLYMKSPHFLRRAMIGLFYPVIYVAKWVVTSKDPKRQERGMDFYYNVVDWVGGYPYEFASIDEITALVNPLGFSLIRSVGAIVPTGCNEFVFQREKKAET